MKLANEIKYSSVKSVGSVKNERENFVRGHSLKNTNDYAQRGIC